MSEEIKIIDVRKNILSDNENQAELIRQDLQSKKVFMVNLMASPGAGKTSLIISTLRLLKNQVRIGVVEGDVESTVDTEKILREGVPAVQIQTGGACHLDAPMINAGLGDLDLANLDFVFIENIGNLICPAEFDTGSDLRVMILSVPEGDDKVLKYPLMFTVCDALIVNKTDYLSIADFDMPLLHRRVQELNPKMKVFEVSCRTGSGMKEWSQWLLDRVQKKIA
jgi:hydrogenase nickel incorporation protein HypB